MTSVQQLQNNYQRIKTLDNRPLYIWGAGNQGRGIFELLQQQSIKLNGFIDKSELLTNTIVEGIKVFSPDVLNVVNNPFIIIASFFFEEEIIQTCLNAGLKKEIDFISYTSIKPFDYAIDVSGVCNLRCIACPRAHQSDRHPKPGFMSSVDFKKVIDKITMEDPFVGTVQLYQWGEPLLNSEISDIISIAHEKKIRCAISSNLNESRNLEKAIQAKPSWFRVSVSGWGKNYEITHTGGIWDNFYKNFLKLADFREHYNPEMKTEVYYHLYKHNQNEDFDKIQMLCERYQFEFHPVFAYLISLDDMLDYLEGAPLPESALKASEMMEISIEQGLALARQDNSKECQTLRCISINCDLSVSNCMMYYNVDGNRAADNFLTTPLEQIVHKKLSSSLCLRCKKQSLHRYCSVYSTMNTDTLRNK